MGTCTRAGLLFDADFAADGAAAADAIVARDISNRRRGNVINLIGGNDGLHRSFRTALGSADETRTAWAFRFARHGLQIDLAGAA